jgi:crotonobetainyl-CoA:carnitine CoA-transferase CaiB-like acyl-CoA transferase
VLTFDEVLSGSQLNSRGYFQEIVHPEAGDFRYPGPPYRLSASPVRMVRAAPTLGQHNREILCDELDLADSEFASLNRAGVV